MNKTAVSTDIIDRLNFLVNVELASREIAAMHRSEKPLTQPIKLLHYYGMPEELLIPLYNYNTAMYLGSEIKDSLTNGRALCKIDELVSKTVEVEVGHSKWCARIHCSYSRKTLIAALSDMGEDIYKEALAYWADMPYECPKHIPFLKFYDLLSMCSLNDRNFDKFISLCPDGSFLIYADYIDVFLKNAGVFGGYMVDPKDKLAFTQRQFSSFVVEYQNKFTRESVDKALKELSTEHLVMHQYKFDRFDLNVDAVIRPGPTPVLLRIMSSIGEMLNSKD